MVTGELVTAHERPHSHEPTTAQQTTAHTHDTETGPDNQAASHDQLEPVRTRRMLQIASCTPDLRAHRTRQILFPRPTNDRPPPTTRGNHEPLPRLIRNVIADPPSMPAVLARKLCTKLVRVQLVVNGCFNQHQSPPRIKCLLSTISSASSINRASRGR